jgi:hypothetical protein
VAFSRRDKVLAEIPLAMRPKRCFDFEVNRPYLFIKQKYKILILPGLSFFQLSCSNSPTRNNTALWDDPDAYFVSGCTIFNAGIPVWSFHASLCHFYSDGSFLAGTGSQLTFYDNNEKPIWMKAINPHHMISTTADDRILVLAEDWVRLDSRKFNFRILKVYKGDNPPSVQPFSISGDKYIG